MNLITRVIKLGWLGLMVLCLTAQLAAAAEKPNGCTVPQDHRFDFWIGDWDVFDNGGTAKVAHVVVDRLLEGCVLREQYEGSDGHQGQSLSIYDRTRNVWHQTWVTNRGELLVIEGQFRNGAMVLSGKELKDEAPTLVRGTWTPVSGGVSEKAVLSTDGGKTWTTWLDLIFRRAQKRE